MERWVPIRGYEGSYEINENGEIRTCEGKITTTERHGIRKWKQRILKQKTDKYGYKRITLWLNGKPKDYLVHRLVAHTFCERSIGKNIINHIDGNPANNHYTNLEWCTYTENLLHAFKNKLNKSPDPIKLVNKETGEKHIFYSKSEASKFLGKNHGYVSGLLKRGKNETTEFKIIEL